MVSSFYSTPVLYSGIVTVLLQRHEKRIKTTKVALCRNNSLNLKYLANFVEQRRPHNFNREARLMGITAPYVCASDHR